MEIYEIANLTIVELLIYQDQEIRRLARELVQKILLKENEPEVKLKIC